MRAAGGAIEEVPRVMMLRGMALPEGGEGVRRGGRPGCPAGFESRARHANAGRRGRLNYPCIYVLVEPGGGTGFKCASDNLPRGGAGIGHFPGAWPGWGSIPRGGISFIRENCQYST